MITSEIDYAEELATNRVLILEAGFQVEIASIFVFD